MLRIVGQSEPPRSHFGGQKATRKHQTGKTSHGTQDIRPARAHTKRVLVRRLTTCSTQRRLRWEFRSVPCPSALFPLLFSWPFCAGLLLGQGSRAPSPWRLRRLSEGRLACFPAKCTEDHARVAFLPSPDVPSVSLRLKYRPVFILGLLPGLHASRNAMGLFFWYSTRTSPHPTSPPLPLAHEFSRPDVNQPKNRTVRERLRCFCSKGPKVSLVTSPSTFPWASLPRPHSPTLIPPEKGRAGMYQGRAPTQGVAILL